ncbi:MAG: ribonuclease P protein component [Anaerosomatales bacterium]|nr:ribonuclease P protein component [Anaerosomatales bacterium]
MSTITSPGDIDRLFKEGARASQAHAVVIAIRTEEPRDPDGRVVFVAGKKLGGAVVRNRSKRVLRAALARLGGPWPGWDVALIARRGAGDLPPHDLDAELGAALRRVGVVPT